MKTLRLHAPGDLRLHDEPLPIPELGESLLKVSAVGICGSDLHWFSEGVIGDDGLERPLIMGHEFAGLDEAGHLVACDPSIPCGHCQYCLEGNPNFCESLRFAGSNGQDGAMREQINWPQKCCYILPEGLDSLDGVMLEPLGVAIHAADLAHLHLGMRVGVFGCGPIGVLAVQLARLSGASQILATDVLPHRLEIAQELGATETVLVEKDSESQAVLAATRQAGLHVIFETAGENAAVETAVGALRPGGKIILAGIPTDNRTSFMASTARRKGATFKLVRRMKNTYPRAIQLVRDRRVKAGVLVTHRFPLSRAAEAFDTAARRTGMKVVIEP